MAESEKRGPFKYEDGERKIMKSMAKDVPDVHWVVPNAPNNDDPFGDKVCQRSGWQLMPDSVEDVLARLKESRTVGMKPGALGMCVLDLDLTDPADPKVRRFMDDVRETFDRESVCAIRSGSGGAHVYVATTLDYAMGFKNGNHYIDGIHSGEYRGGKGYAVVWHPTAEWDKFIRNREALPAQDDNMDRFMAEHGRGGKRAAKSSATGGAGGSAYDRGPGWARVPVDPPRSTDAPMGEWPGESAGDAGSPSGRHNRIVQQMVYAYNKRWVRGVHLVEAEARRVFLEPGEADMEIAGAHKHAGGDKPDPRTLPESEQWTDWVRVQPDGSVKKKADGTPDMRSRSAGGGRRQRNPEEGPDRTLDGMMEQVALAGFQISFDEVKHEPMIRAEDGDWQTLDDSWGAHVMDVLEGHHNYRIGTQRFDKNLLVMERRPEFVRNEPMAWLRESVDVGTEYELEAAQMFLSDHLGVPDTPGNRHISLCIFAQPLLKILRPGCRIKGIPVAVGLPNVGKSRLARSLVPPPLRDKGYYLEGMRLKNDDFDEITYLTEGMIWVEMDEMPGLTKKSQEWKSWLTAGNRKAREKHARRPRWYVNRSAILGTSNPGMFLADDLALATRFLCFEMAEEGLDVDKIVTENQARCYNGAMRAIDRGFDMFNHVVPDDIQMSIFEFTAKCMFHNVTYVDALNALVDMAHNPVDDPLSSTSVDLIRKGLTGTALHAYLVERRPELKGHINPIGLGRALANAPHRFSKAGRDGPWRVIAQDNVVDMGGAPHDSGGGSTAQKLLEASKEPLDDAEFGEDVLGQL